MEKQKHQRFLQRSLERMKARYLGFDLRIIPFFGLVALIVSAAVIRQPTWLPLVLGYSALILLFACFALSMNDVWKEDRDDAKDLVKLRKAQLGQEAE